MLIKIKANMQIAGENTFFPESVFVQKGTVFRVIMDLEDSWLVVMPAFRLPVIIKRDEAEVVE